MVIRHATYKVVLRLSTNRLIHVSSFGLESDGIVTCSKGCRSIDVWSCSAGVLIDQHQFDEPILACSSIPKHEGRIIRVTLESGSNHYLSLWCVSRWPWEGWRKWGSHYWQSWTKSSVSRAFCLTAIPIFTIPKVNLIFTSIISSALRMNVSK